MSNPESLIERKHLRLMQEEEQQQERERKLPKFVNCTICNNVYRRNTFCWYCKLQEQKNEEEKPIPVPTKMTIVSHKPQKADAWSLRMEVRKQLSKEHTPTPPENRWTLA